MPVIYGTLVKRTRIVTIRCVILLVTSF